MTNSIVYVLRDQLHGFTVFNVMPDITLWSCIETNRLICQCRIIRIVPGQSIDLYFGDRIR